MRKSKAYAEGEGSQFEQGQHSAKHGIDSRMKSILGECQQLILSLRRENEGLLHSNKQKDGIIAKLIEEKQEHMLHMGSCNSEQLRETVTQGELKHQKMADHLQQVQQRYEELIDQHMAQISKLKSYNRALRVENTNFREAKEEGNRRKVGSISHSCRKDSQQALSLQQTQATTLKAGEGRLKHFEGVYQTPETLKSQQSAVLPSTQYSKSRPGTSEQRLWRSKQLPRNLFSNHKLMEVEGEGERQMQVGRVMRRLREMLASSDEEST